MCKDIILWETSQALPQLQAPRIIPVFYHSSDGTAVMGKTNAFLSFVLLAAKWWYLIILITASLVCISVILIELLLLCLID